MKQTDKKRQQWMAAFEDFLVQMDPRFAGRVPWDAARFHFDQGRSPGLAVAHVLNSEQPRGDAFPTGAKVRES